MKQTLNLKTSQQLTLSPQLQQAIRLLQLSTIELNEEIERALEDNPLLEHESDEAGEPGFDASGTMPGDLSSSVHDAPDESESDERGDHASENNDDDGGADSDVLADFEAGSAMAHEDFVLSSDEGGLSADDEEHNFQHAAGTSLRDHLLSQLALTSVAETVRPVVMALIDEVDDNGYLATDYPEFCAHLKITRKLTPKAFDAALHVLQSFDPLGVGARTPAECLALQLTVLPSSPAREAALAIVANHLPELAQRDFVAIKKKLRIRDDLLREAHGLIRGLNPKPGARYDNDRLNHIVPDIIVRKQNNRWQAFLNETAVPKIRINAMYAEMLGPTRGSAASATQMLSSRLQEARWLIRNIQQRFDTILRVSRAIVERQQRFFDHGPMAMRPMVLQDIASLLSLHESTISRVTTQKFMLTPQGTVELKYFFSSHVTTSAGGAASSTAIRALIKKIIDEEPPVAPLSDQKITELLGKEGIMVARRTVAKYREALLIPPAHQRKDF